LSISIFISHTDFSLLDGYGMVEEYATKWKTYGNNFLCVSDHGMMAAIPRQIKACEPSGKKDDPLKDKRLEPLFASELYVNPLQIEVDSPEQWEKYKKSLDPASLKKLSKKGYHLLAIAENNLGYENLVKLSSLAWTKGYYYGRPRLNHEQLQKYKEGIVFTSCCYASEIGQAYAEGGEEAGFAMVERYMAMFGPKQFYLEIMMLDFKLQKDYDRFIIKAHLKYGLPIILTNDVHYCNPEDSKYQRLQLMVQTNTTMRDLQKRLLESDSDDVFVLQSESLSMKTEEDLDKYWMVEYADAIDYEIYKEAKRNTVRVANRCKGVKLDRSVKLPKIEDANEKLFEAVKMGAMARNLPKNSAYTDRLKEEYSLICRKEFSSYFLIVQMMTNEARRISPQLLGWGDGSEAVGPGRGSAVGSLVCYCLGITDVDPVRHKLLFKRFLSEARGGRSMRLRFKGKPVPRPNIAA